MKSRFSGSLSVIVAVIVLCFPLIPPGPGQCQPTGAQKNAAPAAPAGSTAPAAAPAEKQPITLGRLMDLASALSQSVLDLKKQLADLPNLQSLEEDLLHLESNMARSDARLIRLEVLQSHEYDQMVDLQTALHGEQAALAMIAKPVGKALNILETAQDRFTREKQIWQTLRQSLPQDLPMASVDPVFENAQTDISTALQLINEHLGPVIDLQQKVVSVDSRLQGQVAKVETMLSTVRSEIFSKASPSMFSSEFYMAFRGGLWREWQTNLDRIQWPGGRFIARWGWVCFLQGLLILALALVLVRNRERLGADEYWAYVAARPVAAALLLGVAAGWPFYRAIPFTWRVLLWAVVGISTSRLLSARLSDPVRVRMLRLLAVVLIASELLRMLNMPTPVYRLFAFFLAAFGLVFFIRQFKASCEEPWQQICLPFLLGALVCGVVLGSEMGGYNNLASHVLSSTLKTVFLLLVAWSLVDAAQHLLAELLSGHVTERMEILRLHSEVIQRRVLRLFRLGAGALVLCLALVIWKFYENPLDALTGMGSWGFSLGGHRITLGLAVVALIVLYGAFLLSWVVQSLILEEASAKRQWQKGVQMSMARLVHYALITFGVLFALGALGFDLKNVTIIGGALGVGIGFGLQAIVNNFVSGLILLFERPIKVGDYVEISGQWAEIKDIGLRATTVQTFDRADIVVPNSELISNQVTNWTRSDRLARLKVAVGVAYGSDVPLVMQILTDCMANHREILRSPEPRAYFIRFGDSSLDFELRFHIKDIDQWYPVLNDVHVEIDRRFREAGIEIPFPQRDVHIRQGAAPPAAPESEPAEDS